MLRAHAAYALNVPDDELRRRVPRTDAVLADPALVAAAERLGRETVKAAVRQAQERVRAGRSDAGGDGGRAARRCGCLPASSTTLHEVLNATGVVLHTNLGRAPLSAAAIDALRAQRGHRRHRVRPRDRSARAARPRDARGARPGAARTPVMSRSSTTARRRCCWPSRVLAAGREVVVSRGELVEIGDGFRLPDLLVSDRCAAARGRHDQPHRAARLLGTPSARTPAAS